MQVFWNDDSSPFRKFIVNVTVVLLVSLKLAIIHGFDEPWRSSQEGFDTCVFHGGHYLSGQGSKGVGKVFVLCFRIFSFLIFWGLLGINFGLRLLFLLLADSFRLCLLWWWEDDVGLWNFFEDEDDPDHWLVAQRSRDASEVEPETDWILKLWYVQFILVKDLLDILIYF